jgi:hypothetical protein
MKNLEEVERHFVEGARRAWSPSTQDADRVLLALDHRMVDPRSMAESSHTALPRVGTEPSRVGEGMRQLFGSAFLSPIARLLLAAVALSTGAGSAGYALGFRAGARATPPMATQVAEPAPLPASKATPSEAAFREPASPATSALPPKTSQSGHDERDVAAASRSSGSTQAKQASAPLDEEVRTLRRVERALREGNPRLALALLEDLDRAVPNGQLGMERSAASTLARCALGYGSPSALLEDFSKQHPSSAYLARIRQECATKPADEGGSE